MRHIIRTTRPALIIIAIAVGLFALLVATSPKAHATGGGHGHTPVTICHKGHEITVDDDAVPGHLRHGDTVGTCAPCPEPTVTPTDEPTEPTPTEEPTVVPTEEPTEEPTPTQEPTVTPTTEPTVTPEPSDTPTVPVVTEPESPDLTPVDEPIVDPVVVTPQSVAPNPVAAEQAPAAVAPVVSEVYTATTVPSSARLAETGASTGVGILVGLVLTVAGVALWAISRRRTVR